MNEVILAIIDRLKVNLAGKYKKYIYGEVRVPDEQMYPFIEVIPMTSRLRNRGTGGMMDNEYGVMIVVKTTIKKYLKAQEGHTQDLIKQIEERDTNGVLLDGTILGVLHNNLQLTIFGNRRADINGEWDVEYKESDLGESFLVQAAISFTVKRIS